MTTSAYQSWLKKREFKAPRPPPSPASKSTTSSSLSVSIESSQSTPNQSQDAHRSSQSNSAKFHAVSAVETTQVTVKFVARPSAVRKRPRSWISSREEAGGEEERSRVVKVAGKTYVAGRPKDKAAESKSKKDVMKTTTLKLAHASKVLRQSSAKRELERSVSSGRIDGETKVEENEAKSTIRDKNSSVQLTQLGKRKMEKGASGDDTAKRRRFDAETKLVGGIGLGKVQGVGQNKVSMQQNMVVGKMQSIVESVTNDGTMKRLRFDDDAEESDRDVEERELLLKSPLKKRKLRTEMLDESQYWMAVDRFSHLT